MIGRTLAHYEITAPLGKGGMGEVWRARDSKLGREVAIKTLPEEFARDGDRLARFEREAKLLASLNHPNIAAIHGFEEDKGTHFLVMELVEGETLADQIKRGAIPVEESLKLALQIAEALEAAHEKGVIHRDLKPANIKVTPDGKVKVLDFGLAKAFAGDAADAAVSNSPTLSMAATGQGVILGTAAYMSPEQTRGREVDKRTDIWAFGCVLYEMLTGRSAFEGEDVTEILASVIKTGANLELLPANIHPALTRVLGRCMEKDTKKRFRDIGDVQFELEQVSADPSGVLARTVPELVQTTRQSTLPWVGAFVLGAIVTGLAVWVFDQPDTAPPVRLTAVHPGGGGVGNDVDADVILSPDGSRMLYLTGTSTRGSQLYVRDFNDPEPRLLVDSARTPFFCRMARGWGFLKTRS